MGAIFRPKYKAATVRSRTGCVMGAILPARQDGSTVSGDHLGVEGASVSA